MPSKNLVFSTDDVSSENLKYFEYWDMVKDKVPDLKVIAFVIAEGLDDRFERWYQSHKDWVEIGVHCYNHERPQEAWREDQEFWIAKARDILLPYLPENYLYRPPGFRVLSKTEKVLKDLGFAGIAHQSHIKYFSGRTLDVYNTHCTKDKYENPIGEIWKTIIAENR